MRKSQLRQHVDNYCSCNHIGSHRAKKHRHYVLHKVIRDLFYIGKVPAKWHAIAKEDIQKLVAFWQKQKISPSTIMKYLKILRVFFIAINHNLTGIGNSNLGINRPKKTNKNLGVSSNFEQKISNPIAKCLFSLQIKFGLTLSEAMRICADIHVQENIIYITRNIATNSKDRIIPVRLEEQQATIADFLKLCLSNKNLIETSGYASLRHTYSTELKLLGLSASKTYRYLYAKMIYCELIKILPPYRVKQTIMREMGLQSRRTLWNYFNE